MAVATSVVRPSHLRSQFVEGRARGAEQFVKAGAWGNALIRVPEASETAYTVQFGMAPECGDACWGKILTAV